jgi:hypothetical protein
VRLRVIVLGLRRGRQQGGDSKVARPTFIQGGNTAVGPYYIVFVTVLILKNTLYSNTGCLYSGRKYRVVIRP